MPTLNSTCTVRMGCDNCGHIDIYAIPVRHEISEYVREDEQHFSEYRRRNAEHGELIFCNNCKMPYLQVFWTSEDNAMHPQEHQQ